MPSGCQESDAAPPFVCQPQSIGPGAIPWYHGVMAKRTPTHKNRKTKTVTLPRLVSHSMIAVLFVGTSFFLGIKSAGEVHPIHTTEAESTTLRGDVNGDGSVTTDDVIAILDIARGYAVPEQWQLAADPNGDSVLTIDDAILLLRSL